ncbi:MAG: hypothetical protein HQL84_11240 [Magnetococcales bacterium]|nr:hypothetical protein [Magnetococcales bacterium]MBF0150608.1 hypothetical protein [Magnetococcales bacterium]MBF0174271.1 hypothetical protein [Magnetococcales bacterium]MBF0348265.1 hypothetical protein [Magnetococcales bacterium]
MLRNYDPGELRTKHKWKKPNAGFVSDGHMEIGKCPETMDLKLAEKLLNGGIVYPKENDIQPQRIYNVYLGVVYRAEPTQPGVSFHGFPEKEIKGRRVPPTVLFQLAKKAQADGTFQLFKTWMKDHLPQGWKIVAPKFR